MRLTFNAYITVKNVEPGRILDTFTCMAEILSNGELDAFLRSKGVDIVSVGITGDYDVENVDN